jgi:GGDEF domain-containing protein
MAPDPFYARGSRVLTPEAFEFVFGNELKRAIRAQTFLTLLVLAAARKGGVPAAEHVMDEIIELIARDVRETDLLAVTSRGTLSLVLLDADLEGARGVVDRLLGRLEHYEFPEPLSIQIGVACCPTHGADLQSLRERGRSVPVVHRSVGVAARQLP